MTTSVGALVSAITRLSIGDSAKAAWDGAYLGMQQFDGCNSSSGVILFSEGVDNASLHTMKEVIDWSRNCHFAVNVIDVGPGKGSDSLKTVATNKYCYYRTPVKSDFESMFYSMMPPFDGCFCCQLAFKSQCLDGAKHSMEIVLKDYCGDPVSATRIYQGEPYGYITLGKDTVKGGSQFALPLRMNLPGDTATFFPSTFTVRVENAGCTLQFLRIETPPGTLLAGVPITATVEGDSITFRTPAPVLLHGDGVLAELIFQSGDPAQPCHSNILLSSWNFENPCMKPRLFNGGIDILPKNLAVESLPAAFSFDVFPDPNNGTVFVKMMLEKPAALDITIVDIFGRTCKTQRSYGAPGGNTFSIDMTAMPAGAYFLIIQGGGLRQVRVISRNY
jgi:hypothetical protein